MRRRRGLGIAIATLGVAFVAAGGAAWSAGPTVTMGDDFFEPQRVKIGQGERVTWRNDGSSDHTVKLEGEKNRFVSPGETTDKRFKQTGRFKYRCTLHSAMTGKVVVGDQ